LFDSCESPLLSVKKEGIKPECLGFQGQYRMILSADTVSKVRQMPSQKRR
jgi:hypothetical protein